MITYILIVLIVFIIFQQIQIYILNKTVEDHSEYFNSISRVLDKQLELNKYNRIIFEWIFKVFGITNEKEK